MRVEEEQAVVEAAVTFERKSHAMHTRRAKHLYGAVDDLIQHFVQAERAGDHAEPFFQRVLLAGLLASLACGVLGSYVVAKRISSLAGGLSHAAFGGVGLGY